MDTRDTTEQAELRRTAEQLARELSAATVADLDDDTRRKRLTTAVRDAGWLELRDDDGNGNGTPVASAVEACIVAEALGAALSDTPFAGVLIGADFARRAGVATATTSVAFDAALLGAHDGGDGIAFVVDVPRDTPGAYVATDLTRLIARVETVTQPVLNGDDEMRWTAFGLALTSADLVGITRGALDLTVDYARERRQYGVPIGSFQAVQHLLADASTLLEGSRSVARHASWAVDVLPPADACAATRVAKAYCTRAARTACETAIQVHGGIGNTWECLAHVYLRRALLSSQWFGDDTVQLRALARARLGAA
jgi:alkylation response protein AidB-like acyl-CoA dehydrogenase